MKICVIGSYAKALVMTADRIPLLGETLIGYDYRETYGGKGSDMAVQAPTSSFQKKSSKSILTRFRQQMWFWPSWKSR